MHLIARSLAGRVARAFAALLLLAFVLGFAGITHGGMHVHGNTMDGDCPFTPGSALCDMSVTAHLSAWGEAFTGVPQEGSALLISALLVLAFMLPVTLILRSLTVLDLFLYLRRRTTYIEPPPLLEQLFSNGILHPKLH